MSDRNMRKMFTLFCLRYTNSIIYVHGKTCRYRQTTAEAARGASKFWWS